MFQKLKKRYQENRDAWHDPNAYVTPLIPYWAFCALCSTPVVLTLGLIYRIATR